jgi:hypothetical protein
MRVEANSFLSRRDDESSVLRRRKIKKGKTSGIETMRAGIFRGGSPSEKNVE